MQKIDLVQVQSLLLCEVCPELRITMQSVDSGRQFRAVVGVGQNAQLLIQPLHHRHHRRGDDRCAAQNAFRRLVAVGLRVAHHWCAGELCRQVVQILLGLRIVE